MPKRIDLDFIARQRKLPLPGIAVLLLAISAAFWTYIDFRDATIQAELLDMNLARYQQVSLGQPKKLDPKEAAQILAATRSLSTPWSALLNDLEIATQNSEQDIALLQVAPDRAKRMVRIAAEARSLPAALTYVEKLQDASALRFPLLENHEIRTADRQRPVRFEISAEWSLPQ
jgi:hypothetical protein